MRSMRSATKNINNGMLMGVELSSVCAQRKVDLSTKKNEIASKCW